MPENNLDEMLLKAQEAEKRAVEGVAASHQQQDATAKEQLEKKLNEHEKALAEARSADEKSREAISLRSKAEQTVEGKENISPEMQAFFEAADNERQMQEARIQELNVVIANFEGDPAVLGVLQAEANEMNRRKELQGEYWKLHKEADEYFGPRGKYDKEYHRHIGGTHSQDDPRCVVEMYAFLATKDLNPGDRKATPKDAEDIINVMRGVNEEARKPDADMLKVDGLYAKWLHGRLEHFSITAEQRIAEAGQGLFEYYKGKDPKGGGDKSVADWAQGMKYSAPSVENYMRDAGRIMSGEGYKARRLVKLGEELGSKMWLSQYIENRPFAVDEY